MSSEVFKAIYSKDPIQKKKKRFLDGYVVVNPRAKQMELFDDHGRALGKSKPNASIIDDGDRGVEYAFVAGFYVEFDYQIQEEDFTSGKCFTKPTEVLPLKAPGPASSHDPLAGKKPSKGAFCLHKPTATFPPSKEAPREEFYLNDIDPALKTTTRCTIDELLLRKLKPHQKEGVQFMFGCVTGLQDPECEGCVLADSMGLGKTLQVITLVWVLTRQSPFAPAKAPGGALHALKRPAPLSCSPGPKQPSDLLNKVEGLVRKVCIVTPLTLLHNWRREFEKWLGDGNCSPVLLENQGEASDIGRKTKSFLKNSNKVLLCTYETLLQVAGLLRDQVDLLVCDEAHRLKNTSTKIFATLSSFRTRRRIFITGTPLQNNLEELFATLNFVAPFKFDSEPKFRSVFTDPINKGLMRKAGPQVKTLANERAKQLTDSLRPIVLRRGEEVLAELLPKKTELFVFLKLSKAQVDLYNQVLSNAQQRSYNVKTNKISEVLAVLSEFRKVLAHPYIHQARHTGVLDHKVSQIEASEDPAPANQKWRPGGPSLPPLTSDPKEDPLLFVDNVRVEDSMKFQFTLRLLERVALSNSRRPPHEALQKTIVVSYSTKILTFLELLLRRRGLECFRLDGQTKLKDRETIIEKFSSPQDRVCVFLLCAKAGGTGLNLVTANRMVLLDVDWNPSNDRQVMARVYREGQKREVLIYRLFAEGTIEEEILNRQFEKECLATILVDKKESVASFGGYEEKENFSEFFSRFLRQDGVRSRVKRRLAVLRELAEGGTGVGDLDDETRPWICKVCVKSDMKEVFCQPGVSQEVEEVRRELEEAESEDQSVAHESKLADPQAREAEAVEEAFWAERLESGWVGRLGEKKQAASPPPKPEDAERQRLLAELGFGSE